MMMMMRGWRLKDRNGRDVGEDAVGRMWGDFVWCGTFINVMSQ